MSSFDTFIPIFKAKPPRRPWRHTRTQARLNALAKAMGNAMGIGLSDGLRKLKTDVDPEAVYQAWLKRDYTGIVEQVPWASVHQRTDKSWGYQAKAMEGGWKISQESLPHPEDPLLRWDTQNPRVNAFIATRRADNFVNLTEDSARNIRAWTSASFDRALSPRQVAMGVRDQIGLLPAHAVAVDKYRSGLLLGGMPGAKADELASQYADRLLDYRAMMIGRTETRLATNQGQLTVWRAAADQGLVDRHTTGKRWITMGPDPCDICEPMDGKTVALDSSWSLEDGTPVDCPPEGTHPHCFCSFEIVYDFDETEED